jgi:AcrR family transcriptional regulator
MGAAPVDETNGPDAAAAFRTRLLDGLATSLKVRGYRETTIADIVRHARTSRRTFYQHFTSKDDCFLALLREANAETIARIEASVDRTAVWDRQVRQAIQAWVASATAYPDLTLSWIRELPSLGDAARQLQRDSIQAFVQLVETLTDDDQLRRAGVPRPPRAFAIVLIGGLRELIATVVEGGGAVSDITDDAVAATLALLGPRGTT